MPVWQLAKQITINIYKISNQGALSKDFAFRNQICRAALSISSNIAEGFERGSPKEFIQFLHIARGSAGEVRSQLIIANELGYLPKNKYPELKDSLENILRQTTALIQSLKK